MARVLCYENRSPLTGCVKFPWSPSCLCSSPRDSFRVAQCLLLLKRLEMPKISTAMPKMRVYKRGFDFPNEGFVQLAIEAHFRAAGFNLYSEGRVDLLCTHPVTGESWHIEAKGQTTQVGLDFRTGLGQLLQAMRSKDSKCGAAVPDTPQFRAQIDKLSSWVVSALNIHWLLVSQDGAVRIVPPGETLGFCEAGSGSPKI